MWLRREFHGLTVNATAGAMARDYFSLFNIEPSFTIDEIALEQVYHSLLSQFHPDRYAGKPQVEQRVAAQLCADINAGYRTLQGEVSRAQYLLQHSGVDLQAAEREGVGADFLMTQILLRERLETIAELDQWRSELWWTKSTSIMRRATIALQRQLREQHGRRRPAIGRRCATSKS